MLFPEKPDPTDEMGRVIFQKFQQLCPGKDPADGVQLQVGGWTC